MRGCQWPALETRRALDDNRRMRTWLVVMAACGSTTATAVVPPVPQIAPSPPSAVATVSGRLVDSKTREGVVGATVVINRESDPRTDEQVVISDEDGAYTLTNIAYGDHRIMVYLSSASAQIDHVHVAAPALTIDTVILDHKLLPLDPKWDERTGRDCTVPMMIDENRDGAVLESCGSLPIDPPSGAGDRALACIVDAVAKHRPFRFDQSWYGIDAGGQRGYMGVVRDGRYVVMKIYYTTDVGGGSSPWSGYADVDECTSLTLRQPRPRRCHPDHDVSDCLECADTIAVERCHRGPDFFHEPP